MTYQRVTEYQVSVFPDEMANSSDLRTAEAANMWVLAVSWRGQDKMAVTGMGRQCLSASGEWDWEMRPSEREDEWLATHRFDLETALRLAAEHAPKVTINGRTALEILAKHQMRESSR